MYDRELYRAFGETVVSRKLFRQYHLSSEELANQKKRFISDEIEYPDFQYVLPERTAIVGDQAHLRELYGQLDQASLVGTTSKFEKKLIKQYQDLIVETLARLDLLVYSYHLLDSEDEFLANADRFMLAGRQVFGAFDEKKWLELICFFKHKYVNLQNSQPANFVKENIVWDRCSDIPVDQEANFVKLLRSVKRPIRDYFYSVLPILSNIRGAKTAEELVGILTQALDDLSFHGWSVALDPSSSAVRVRYATKTVFVPSFSGRISSPSVRAIATHEIGVHIIRFNQSKKLPLYILRRGLAGQNNFEEALAAIAARCVKPGFMPRGTYMFIATGLVLGVDGKKRDFRQTYELLWRAIELSSKLRSTELIKQKAYDMCVRVFRGVPPAVSGHCSLKEKRYYQLAEPTLGLIKSLSVSSSTENALERLLSAKIDFARPSQVDFLKAAAQKTD